MIIKTNIKLLDKPPKLSLYYVVRKSILGLGVDTRNGVTLWEFAEGNLN